MATFQSSNQEQIDRQLVSASAKNTSSMSSPQNQALYRVHANLSGASSDVGRQHRNSQMNLKSNKRGCSNRSRDSKSDAMEFGIIKSLD
ncbi:hypothetical protein PGT21_001725 [Puccinia graminis f. sp. tritici]|uniref:Uncharacterized protein n=1 Tax=Puccinia graminis f. sp. tritici TaxID=56615 RepID=A0A5B0PH25_PUCGR|nr:hypothetical protein PGT21_001725 [Puccinia graminis f. sp. tritici]